MALGRTGLEPGDALALPLVAVPCCIWVGSQPHCHVVKLAAAHSVGVALGASIGGPGGTTGAGAQNLFREAIPVPGGC